MPRIAMIGAGGYVFPLRLIGDILSFPALQDCTLALTDINAERLERTAGAARRLVEHHGLAANVESTTDRRAALKDADVVIITFQVGGVEAYRHDVEIPRRYGIDQPVGDTIGPGGVFRFLRSAPAYRAIAEDVRDLCPDAQVINYANPMAMATWLLTRLGLKAVGLCHSVQGTSRMLARTLDVPYDEVDFISAGINHQAWFLSFKRSGEDLYPRLRELMAAKHLAKTKPDDLLEDKGDHSGAAATASNYEGGNERVRTSIMDMFGYFQTESSHHASEYLPYFRKNPALVEANIPDRWDYYEICATHDEEDHTESLLARLCEKLEPSVEYGAQIVHSLHTGNLSVVYGNVENRDLIPNLPTGCCVELPCLVDKNGVQPTAVGPLPKQLAALNRTNINVQELAVEAALTNEREHVYHAVALDPLTGAMLTLDQIRDMVDELFAAHGL